MYGNDDGLEYIYQGRTDEEQVPEDVEKLIINPGVQVLPALLCFEFRRLQEVILADGLKMINYAAFEDCEALLELKICNTLCYIGDRSFQHCSSLTKVDFETSTSSSSPRHQLRIIDEKAFYECISLQRIKLPSSVTTVGSSSFEECTSLVEANLSTTQITEISMGAFAYCNMLQTVSLPNTLERIRYVAFRCCSELVTVVLPLDSQPIAISSQSFYDCRKVANLVLPKGSTAKEDSFSKCQLLRERYGEDSSRIVAGLIGRFESYAIHRLCYYDHSTVTAVQELQNCIANHQEEGYSLVDEFGMTPFHVLFSTAEPRMELLNILLDSSSLQIQSLLKLKDSNDRRPLDYLMNNWTDGTRLLLQRTLQKWMIDRLASWGATSWMDAMERKVKHLLAEDDDDEERATLCRKVYSEFEHYENLQGTSILEMALWKKKLKSGRTSSDGSKRQALDRDECRCLSGSDVVIPHVAMFLLGIPQPS